MGSKKTIYRTVHPATGEVLFLEKGGRAVLWVTWIDFGQGFIHAGYSSQEDFAKASRAARGTNPYGQDYTATALSVVTAEQRDAELAGQQTMPEEEPAAPTFDERAARHQAELKERMDCGHARESLRKGGRCVSCTSERTYLSLEAALEEAFAGRPAAPVVARVDLTAPGRGLVLVTGGHGLKDSPQALLGRPTPNRWSLEDSYGDEGRAGYYRTGSTIRQAVRRYLEHLAAIHGGFDAAEVYIEVQREY